MNYNKSKVNDNVDKNKRVLCQLKEIGSCFGCCGNNFTNQKEVMNAIKKNSALLKHMIQKHKGEFNKIFEEMNSNYFELRKSGICYSLINFKDFPLIEKFYDIYPKELVEKNLIFGCPMHPIVNNGKELRKCEIDHECKSYHLFKNWDRKKQDEFIEFLKNKKLNPYDYSVGLDNGSLVDEFLQL